MRTEAVSLENREFYWICENTAQCVWNVVSKESGFLLMLCSYYEGTWLQASDCHKQEEAFSLPLPKSSTG